MLNYKVELSIMRE